MATSNSECCACGGASDWVLKHRRHKGARVVFICDDCLNEGLFTEEIEADDAEFPEETHDDVPPDLD